MNTFQARLLQETPPWWEIEISTQPDKSWNQFLDFLRSRTDDFVEPDGKELTFHPFKVSLYRRSTSPVRTGRQLVFNTPDEVYIFITGFDSAWDMLDDLLPDDIQERRCA